MNVLRLCLNPITGVPAATCRKYLEGERSHYGKTNRAGNHCGRSPAPLSEDDTKKGFIERPTPRLVPADTEANLYKLFLDNKWTDGLPIILPTEARVARNAEGNKPQAR